MRPWLGPLVAVILVFALLLVEPSSLGRTLARPAPLLAGGLAAAVATPALAALAAPVLEPVIGPGLLLGLFVFAFAPPTLSSTAYVALMGLEAAPALALCLGLTVVAPAGVPAVAALLGVDFPIDSGGLALRLAAIVGAGVAGAGLIRVLVGTRRLAGARDVVTGTMILPLALFAIGTMDGIGARILAEPGRTAAILGMACLLALAGIAFVTIAALPFGRRAALPIGWCGGNRNLGLIVGAMAGAVPADTWTYFALAQIPLYALPLVALPLYRHLRGEARAPDGNAT